MKAIPKSSVRISVNSTLKLKFIPYKAINQKFLN